MNVAIDIDGVLANFLKDYHRMINTLWPGHIPKGYQPQDFFHTDIMTQEQTRQALEATFKIRGLWRNLEPLPGADTLSRRQFSITAHNIYYVTHRPETPGGSSLEQTNKWLEGQGLRFTNSSTIIVPNSLAKPRIYSELGIQISIDDRDDTVEACMSLPKHFAWLLDKPWNRHAQHLPRMTTMLEFTNMLEANSLDSLADCNPGSGANAVNE